MITEKDMKEMKAAVGKSGPIGTISRIEINEELGCVELYGEGDTFIGQMSMAAYQKLVEG